MGLLNKWMESLDYEFKVLPSCTRHQSPHSSCSICMDSCLEDAITLVDGKPSILQEKCSECGHCIVECPVHAIEGFFPKRNVYQNQLVVKDDHPPALRELLGYYRKGIHGIICEEEELSNDWQIMIEKANRALKQLGKDAFSIQYKKLEIKEETFTRREVFTFWKKEAQSTLMQMAPAKWRFNYKELDLNKFYPNHQFFQISLDFTKCTLCKACERLCQKNCFKINDSDFTLLAQGCSGCMLCQDICPENAITINEEITTAEEAIHPIYIKTCIKCNSNYESLVDVDRKCVKCQKRELFGTFLS